MNMSADKVRKLIMVTGDNNNKYYDMTRNDDNSTWTAKWGRVGVTESTQVYPMEKWDSKYREKVKKGYKDVTEMFMVSGEKTSSFLDISNSAIKQLIDFLQKAAKKSISENYMVSSEAVTIRQVEEAQRILDFLTKVKLHDRVSQINDSLLELYSVIPRRMANVKNHLFHYDSVSTSSQLTEIRSLIEEEQATLDVMSGQVSMQKEEAEVKDKGAVTLLDVLGLGIEVVPDGSFIKKMMEAEGRQFKRAFAVTNKRTQVKFNDYVNTRSNKTVKLFWHGSRNENWLSILEQGLVLRPTNAIRTGSMFGAGIYFADRCKKSLGYTSLSGSYWARGSSNVAYLALYDVHLGNPLKISRHDSNCYNLSWENLKRRGDYDSVFALKGADLYNNEYIVYNDKQCTVKYLVEVTG
jgi:poly [ADP-ribose] polymerase 2/3/4